MLIYELLNCFFKEKIAGDCDSEIKKYYTTCFNRFLVYIEFYYFHEDYTIWLADIKKIMVSDFCVFQYDNLVDTVELNPLKDISPFARISAIAEANSIIEGLRDILYFAFEKGYIEPFEIKLYELDAVNSKVL